MTRTKHRVSLWLALLMIMSLVLAACGNQGGNTGTGGTGNTGTGGGATATTGTGGTGTGTGTGATATTGTGSTGTDMGATATTGTGTGTDAGATATGTGAGAGAGAPATTAAPPECPEAAQGQTVEMWSPLTGPDGDEMTRLAQQFSQENNRGITVRHTAQPEYLQRLNASAAAKKLPTMTVIRAGDIPTMAARNILKPMSEQAMGAIASGNISNDFPEEVWNVGQIKGQRYAFPLDVHPLVMYYNKALFKQAGIPEPGTDKPMTKEEFESAVNKLNQGGNIGWAIGTLFSADTMFQMLVRQFGGSMVNEDGTQATYNSPEAVRALEYIRDQKQKFSPKISGTGDPEVVQFQQGKVGVVFHGPWHISNLQKLPFTGFAPVPQLGERYSVWGGSHQLGLTTEDPAQQTAAGCWIGWLSANSVQWAKAGQLPVRQSVANSPQLAQEAAPIAAVAIEAPAVDLYPPVPDLEGAVMTEASKAIAAVVQGQQKDVKAALDQAVQRSNQIIQQNAKRYGTQ